MDVIDVFSASFIGRVSVVVITVETGVITFEREGVTIDPVVGVSVR